MESLERGESPAGVFCDLSKAFDCVHHGKLLSKLFRYGIRGVPHSWLTSYLTDRRQYVLLKHHDDSNHIGTFRSGTSTVNVGVPQGSVIGPILFILYVNDFCSSLDSHVTMYADDTSLLVSDGDLRNFQAKMDDMALRVSGWFSHNYLYLNANKTNYVIFHTRQRFAVPKITAVLNDVVLAKGDSASFLGVIFDETLSFHDHCEVLTKKLDSRCYQLRALRSVLSTKDLINCYYALVHSLLTYGIAIWGSSASCPDVFLAQKRIIRCIAGVKPTHSCRGLFSSYRILTVPAIYIYELVTYVFQRLDCLDRRESVHSHDTRRKRNLLVPFRHLHLTANTPSCLGVKLFNLLPNCCKEADKVHVFKRRVKCLLTDLCCYSIDEYIQALS